MDGDHIFAAQYLSDVVTVKTQMILHIMFLGSLYVIVKGTPNPLQKDSEKNLALYVKSNVDLES